MKPLAEPDCLTEITAATEFYTGENYHQNYFNQNGYQPYCMMVINPTVQKFRKAYASLLRRYIFSNWQFVRPLRN